MTTHRFSRRPAAKLAAVVMLVAAGATADMPRATGASVKLPAPRRTGALPVEGALDVRRSLREFAPAAISLAELSQLLWAAQGTSAPDGRRTAPSAGALYPLEVSVVAGTVTGLPPGVYRYRSSGHQLVPVASGDRRRELAAAALDQQWMEAAPVAFVIAAVFSRTERKYGVRGAQYVHFEAGCAAENLALQAAALGLGTVVVGAFEDARVASVAALAENERPLAILPAGRPR